MIFGEPGEICNKANNFCTKLIDDDQLAFQLSCASRLNTLNHVNTAWRNTRLEATYVLPSSILKPWRIWQNRRQYSLEFGFLSLEVYFWNVLPSIHVEDISSIFLLNRLREKLPLRKGKRRARKDDYSGFNNFLERLEFPGLKPGNNIEHGPIDKPITRLIRKSNRPAFLRRVRVRSDTSSARGPFTQFIMLMDAWKAESSDFT